MWCISLLDEDEDGDRITVRSDEEMKAMLSYVGAVWQMLMLSMFVSFCPCVSACVKSLMWAAAFPAQR